MINANFNKMQSLHNKSCARGCGNFRSEGAGAKCPNCGGEASKVPFPSEVKGFPAEKKDDF